MATTMAPHTPPDSTPVSFAQPGAFGEMSSVESDPWTWGVDEVVAHVCDVRNPEIAAVRPQSRPNMQALEQALRENDIDGPALLVEVTTDTMKSHLGIKSLGHCATINRVIKALQLKSPAYIGVRQQEAMIESSSMPKASHPALSDIGFASHAIAGHIQGSLPAAFRTQEWLQQTQTPLEAPPQDRKAPPLFENSHPGSPLPTAPQAHDTELPRSIDVKPKDPNDTRDAVPARPNETYIVDQHGQKRRRLDLTGLNQPLAVDLKGVSHSPSFSGVHTPAPQPTTPEPTPVESHKASKIPLSSPSRDPAASQGAGIVTRDEHGRKRVIPVSIDRDLPINHYKQKDGHAQLSTTSCNQARDEQRSGRKGYLGIKALPVDDLFYGGTPMGGKMQDEGVVPSESEFTLVSRARNLHGALQDPGKQIFVSKRLQYFMRSQQVETVGRQGETLWDVVPYPERLGLKHHKLSMTRYSLNRGDIKVTRLDRSSLIPDTRPGRLYDEENRSTINLPGLSLVEVGKEMNWDMLEKWKHLDDGDVVQPLYGESGSENEFSIDLWREIEEEQGVEVERPKTFSRQKIIDEAEVNAAIDRTIDFYVLQWNEKQRPRMELKAWRLWQKSRRSGNVSEQVIELESKVQVLGARLERQRKEVCREAWRKTKDVAQACRNMQPTIEDLEEARWSIMLLAQKRSPPRPPKKERRPRVIKIKRAEEMATDEENLVDEGPSPGSSTESEDSMGSFVVEDESGSVNMEEELDVAQADDEDCHSHDKASKGQVKFERVDQTIHERTDKTEIIDLTQLSNPSQASQSTEFIPNPAPLIPPLQGGSESDDPFSRPTTANFKQPPGPSNVIELSSDTDKPDLPTSRSPQLPKLSDVKAIARLDPAMLAERQDRKRLLIYYVHLTPLEIRNQMLRARELDEEEMWSVVKKILTALYQGSVKLRGFSESDRNAYMRIAVLYVSWTIPVPIDSTGLEKRHIKVTLRERQAFGYFYESLLDCLNYYAPLTHQSLGIVSHSDATPSQSKKLRMKRIVSDEDDDIDQYNPTPTKKRKYAVPETQQTLDMRYNAQQRVKELQQRQAKVQRRVAQMRVNEGDAAKILVNVGKEDHQHDIFLNPSIGKLIQPHQSEGVRFMWRELTTDHEDLQGCLLAQTMGLGKTMQVVSVLVAIAEASKSDDHDVREQVPRQLRESKTLILCPPSLIENWFEELLMWAPSPHNENIGDIRKVTSAMKPQDRFAEIEAWKDGNGVLILGYTTFRSIVNKKDDASEEGSSKELASIIDILLRFPNIVIADEAHFFKNFDSIANKAIHSVKCKSRIALTGSPLSNNLNEYYALVDWIAPGYLGNFVEFKANFAEPIQAGLYADSTPAEYRDSRKKLQALQTDLEPKVHRADATILKERLFGKTEFVVRLSLTPLQDQVYREFLESTYGAPGKQKEMETETATLWALLGLLKLLCNHPYCFRRHLLELRSAHTATGKKGVKGSNKLARKQSSREKASTEEEIDLMNYPRSSSLLSTKTIECNLQVFKNLDTSLRDESLSPKMQLLSKILDLSQRVGDKCLVFTQSIPTLNYIEKLIETHGHSYCRIDGSTKITDRQQMCKDFNSGSLNVCIISTKAGGQGLNMFGANRVIIMDGGFNPMWEEQAIGRAYRIGQLKPVFVYHLLLGGTFEDRFHEQSIFKQQLATRVVDKKNPNRYAEKGVGQYLHPPKAVVQKDLAPLQGKDTKVLDHILNDTSFSSCIRSIDPTETFHEEDNFQLTAEEKLEAAQLQKQQQLRRTDPIAYNKAMQRQTASFLTPAAAGLKRPASFSTQAKTASDPAIANKAVPRPLASGQEPVLQSAPSRPGKAQPAPPNQSGETKPIVFGNVSVGSPVQHTDTATRQVEQQQGGIGPPNLQKSQQSVHPNERTAPTPGPMSPNMTFLLEFLQAFSFLNIEDKPYIKCDWLSQVRSTLIPRFHNHILRLLMHIRHDGDRDADVCRYAIQQLTLSICIKAINEDHCRELFNNVFRRLSQNADCLQAFYTAFRDKYSHVMSATPHDDDNPIVGLMAGSSPALMREMDVELEGLLLPTSVPSPQAVRSPLQGSDRGAALRSPQRIRGSLPSIDGDSSAAGKVLGGENQDARNGPPVNEQVPGEANDERRFIFYSPKKAAKRGDSRQDERREKGAEVMAEEI